MNGNREIDGGAVNNPYESQDNNGKGRCLFPNCWQRADREINGVTLCRYHAKHLLGVST